MNQGPITERRWVRIVRSRYSLGGGPLICVRLRWRRRAYWLEIL